MARSVYKKLKALLPEHAQEIQAYRDDLYFFKRNIMIQPDFVAPLATDYPKKDELMAELRMLDRISRIWNTVGTVLLLLGIAYMFVSFMF